MGSSVIFECPKCQRKVGSGYMVGIGLRFFSMIPEFREEIMTNPKFSEQKRVMESEKDAIVWPSRKVFQCERCKHLQGCGDYSILKPEPKKPGEQTPQKYKMLLPYTFSCEKCGGIMRLPEKYLCPDCGTELVKKRGNTRWD